MASLIGLGNSSLEEFFPFGVGILRHSLDCNDILLSFLKLSLPTPNQHHTGAGRENSCINVSITPLEKMLSWGSLGQDPRSDLGTDISFSDSSLTQYSITDPKDRTGSVCKTQNFLSDFFFSLINSHTPNSLCPRQHSPVVALSTDVRSSSEKVLKDQKPPQKLVQRNTTPVCCVDNAEKSSLNLPKIKHRHFNYPHQAPPSRVSL